jgi:hypothetical protein
MSATPRFHWRPEAAALGPSPSSGLLRVTGDGAQKLSVTQLDAFLREGVALDSRSR